MSNSLFSQLNKHKGNSFIDFMNANKGKDPNAMLNELVSSGKVSQEQLNQVQQYAQNNMNKFSMFKSMFGF